MKSSVTLGSVVHVKQRFARSANVERDAEGSSVEGYIPTARALDVISRLAEGIVEPALGRAVSITGPYGSGKSSLALFLSALFCHADDSARIAADRILDSVDPALGRRLTVAREALAATRSGFVRAVVTAQREPVMATILRALRVGVSRYARNEADARAVPEFRRVLNADPLAIKTAADIRDLASAVAGVAPILLVLDEFGKNLEFYGASTSGAEDLYVLQDLAEWAAGDDALPLVMVTLQHLAFEDYVVGASVAQRREWSKVLGRFADIPYVETPAQAQGLIASVFEPTAAHARPRGRIRAWADICRDETDACGLMGALHVDLAKCYPLHPVTLAVLPDLCSRYGQNERTLFSFLAGAETLSVRGYLAETVLPEAPALPSVRLDLVYDYFLESASTMVGASATASRWLEIETRIRDTQGLSAAQQRVLKAIGVLNLVSAGGALRASRRVVAFATADGQSGTEDSDAVEGVITALEANGLVTYRAFADEFRIWSGTDFDLKGSVEEARRRLRDEPIAALLERVRPLSPLVAARHSQITGTLRVFERRYVDRHSAEITPLPASSPGDGLVLLCVDPDEVLPDVAVMAERDKPVLVGRTDSAAAISESAYELAAHLDVLNTASDLESDWVARRELRERAAVATLALDTALERGFGPAGRTVRWARLPGLVSQPAKGGLSAALSEICDERYPATPKIRNEMLARRDLTSQGARARRDLLEAMVDHPDQLRLGLAGYGPERAMYEAMLFRTGMHRNMGGGWGFHAPYRHHPLNFRPTWLAIEAVFDTAADRQVSVGELFERLMAPPLGLKEGPIPVAVTAALLARADDIALYEDGTFVTRLTADAIERLAKNPGRFTVKGYATRGERGRVVSILAEALGVVRRLGGRSRVGSVVSIAAPLLSKIRNLTPYAKRTKQLSNDARAVRQALFDAREPDELIFSTLPTCLGQAPFSSRGTISDDRIWAYARALTAAVAEIDGLYGHLLDDINESVAAGLGSPPDRMRQDGRLRAGRLAGEILEPQLRSFALALSDEHLDRDEWLPYIGMLLANKPTASWTDDDRARFDQRSRQISSAFRRVESLHFSQAAIPAEGFEAVRITLTLVDGTDVPQVVWVDESATDILDDVVDEALTRVVGHLGERGREMLLATIAKRVLAPEERAAQPIRHSQDHAEREVRRG